jgi:hypothetical protein
MRTVPAMLFSALLAFSGPVLAVYKCETGGKITYGDQPCASAVVLNVPGAPDAQDAKRRAALETTDAQRLERERHKREAAAEREQRRGASAGAAHRKKCENFARRQKRANEDVASSAGVASDKAKLKARRINEDYEAACGRWPERQIGLAR